MGCGRILEDLSKSSLTVEVRNTIRGEEREHFLRQFTYWVSGIVQNEMNERKRCCYVLSPYM